MTTAFPVPLTVASRRAPSTLQVELFRKAIHMSIAAVPVIAAVNVLAAAALLSFGIVVYLAAEQARITGVRVAVISDITVLAMRERDRQGFVLAPVTLGLGAMLCLLLYPEPAASIAIYALAFGDSAASIVGTAFGRITIPGTGGKSLTGSLACFGAVALISWRVTGLPGAALLIGGAAALLEVAPTRDFDNLILPVGAGLVAHQLIV